jgi:hypothetical protein
MTTEAQSACVHLADLHYASTGGYCVGFPGSLLSKGAMKTHCLLLGMAHAYDSSSIVTQMASPTVLPVPMDPDMISEGAKTARKYYPNALLSRTEPAVFGVLRALESVMHDMFIQASDSARCALAVAAFGIKSLAPSRLSHPEQRIALGALCFSKGYVTADVAIMYIVGLAESLDGRFPAGAHLSLQSLNERSETIHTGFSGILIPYLPNQRTRPFVIGDTSFTLSVRDSPSNGFSSMVTSGLTCYFGLDMLLVRETVSRVTYMINQFMDGFEPKYRGDPSLLAASPASYGQSPSGVWMLGLYAFTVATGALPVDLYLALAGAYAERGSVTKFETLEFLNDWMQSEPVMSEWGYCVCRADTFFLTQTRFAELCAWQPENARRYAVLPQKAGEASVSVYPESSPSVIIPFSVTIVDTIVAYYAFLMSEEGETLSVSDTLRAVSLTVDPRLERMLTASAERSTCKRMLFISERRNTERALNGLCVQIC